MEHRELVPNVKKLNVGRNAVKLTKDNKSKLDRLIQLSFDRQVLGEEYQRLYNELLNIVGRK